MKNGHTMNKCYYRKVRVPKGKFTWIPKGKQISTNMRGPKFALET